MRRKPGTLVPLEALLLEAGIALSAGGADEWHGYQLARELRRILGARYRTAYGTLYRALERLEAAGMLESRWEDPATAEAEGRPRRRLYSVTAPGERALDGLERQLPATLRPREATA